VNANIVYLREILLRLKISRSKLRAPLLKFLLTEEMPKHQALVINHLIGFMHQTDLRIGVNILR
jgi:hypothetical protein